jgi:hypothetical protein
MFVFLSRRAEHFIFHFPFKKENELNVGGRDWYTITEVIVVVGLL